MSVDDVMIQKGGTRPYPNHILVLFLYRLQKYLACGKAPNKEKQLIKGN